MKTFADREEKVLSFMERVQEEQLMQEQEDAFQNSTDYKLKVLNKCENDAKGVCLDKIFAKIYKDAVPLNDDYKVAYGDDLDADFKNFMDTRCPKGMEYYVKEGLKKKSPFAQRVLEAVEDLVKNEYNNKALNIEDVDAKDLVFNSNDDVQQKLDVIGKDLATPEISQAIQDNVKQTALSEITRAKKEKEALKSLESDLANNINVTTAESVKTELELRDIGTPKDYVPSLFEAVMINKLNHIQPTYESGEMQEVYLYGALDDYKTESLHISGPRVEIDGSKKDKKKRSLNEIMSDAKIPSGVASKIKSLASESDLLELFNGKGSSDRVATNKKLTSAGISGDVVNAIKDEARRYEESVNESEDNIFASPEDLAFVEAVKEYTALSMLKALKLESFSKYETEALAQEYAQG